MRHFILIKTISESVLNDKIIVQIRRWSKTLVFNRDIFSVLSCPLCCVFFLSCLVCLLLPVSLDWPFLCALSVFSNVYIRYLNDLITNILNEWLIQDINVVVYYYWDCMLFWHVSFTLKIMLKKIKVDFLTNKFPLTSSVRFTSQNYLF